MELLVMSTAVPGELIRINVNGGSASGYDNV